jgi:hypothetical protein
MYKDSRGLKNSNVFYYASKTPYTIALAMLNKAYAISNTKS